MKRTIVICAAAAMLAASAIYAFGDIARPKVTPAPGKIVFHTGLSIATDAKAYEARLQISEESLKRLREATAGAPTNESMTQRVMHSSTRTMMAGLFMFLAVSFAGVWLARSQQRRNHKMIAAAVMFAAVLGLTTVIVRANAGPPGSYRWRNLPENLSKGQATIGGLDIEIVPGDSGMKLIMPLKSEKKTGEE
jgi:cytochrome bd-type quinol oxidase subunit 1